MLQVGLEWTGLTDGRPSVQNPTRPKIDIPSNRDPVDLWTDQTTRIAVFLHSTRGPPCRTQPASSSSFRCHPQRCPLQLSPILRVSPDFAALHTLRDLPTASRLPEVGARETRLHRPFRRGPTIHEPCIAPQLAVPRAPSPQSPSVPPGFPAVNLDRAVLNDFACARRCGFCGVSCGGFGLFALWLPPAAESSVLSCCAHQTSARR